MNIPPCKARAPALLPAGAMLINVSRGELVDEAARVSALFIDTLRRGLAGDTLHHRVSANP